MASSSRTNDSPVHVSQVIKLVDPLTLFSLFEAAHLFDHKNLKDLTCQILLSMVKGKSAEEIRTHFIINQDYDDWISPQKPSTRPTLRRKEAFIMPPDCDLAQRSHRVTKGLHFIYGGKSNTTFKFTLRKLLKPQSGAGMLSVTMSISSIIKDQVLARHLNHDHVVHLFNMLEQHTPQREVLCFHRDVLHVLSRVNFTAHRKVMGTDRFQLLVDVIDNKVFGIYSREVAPLAVLTLTNIVNTLPMFVVDILKTGVLECLKRVLLAPRTDKIVKCIAMFLVAACRTIYLSGLDKDHKVDLALATLQVLELSVSVKHNIEQACNAFQYLTHGMELQIEDLTFKRLIQKLIAIIQKPPPGNCRFPGYALGVLGNIAIWGSSNQIKIMALTSMFLESLVMAMIADSKKIQKEACLIISKIAAQKEGLIEEMHSARLTGALCGLLETDESEQDEFEDADVKREAVWAIYSCIYGSSFSSTSLDCNS